jgi:hypothetical protein
MKKLQWFGLAFAIILVSGTSVYSQGSKKPGKADESPKIIQIDFSKLPPELQKALLDFQKTQQEAAPKKGVANAISLSEAIAIAENLGKGRAMSADRKDGLDYTHFNVNIAHADGTRTRYTLGATGNVLQQKKYQKERD